MRTLTVLILASLVSLTTQAQSRGSEPLSKNDKRALEQTQDMLRNRNQVDAFLEKNPEARGADSNVQALMGPDTDATYDLAADIFADLVKQTNGDPEKLMQLLEQAKKNPAAFAQKLSPAQQDKIRGLATKVEQRQNKAPAPH
ncbi:MAG: hypothetical protein V4760_11105 [Bdellovibrionota bacterium]